MPRKDKALPAGPLAEWAAHSDSAEYAEADGMAAIARPVVWKGRLAKVIVVAVPWECRSVLEPQSSRRQWRPDPRFNPRAATAAF